MADKQNRAAGIGCVDAEQLAAYVDGRLDASARRKVEAHLARCGDCRSIFAETAAFARGDAKPAVRPSKQWPKYVLAALATAAVLVLLIYVRQASTLRTDRPELAELVAAAATEPTRLTEGRLTGGFAYKPAPVPTRGASDRNISPEVKIAAAKIEQTMRGKESAYADAALGASYLAVGDLDKAVDYLESAVDEKPDAQYQNDLAAAYIARASRTGRAEDWPKAYALAERAAKADPKLVEPCFNKALALEGLNLASDAADMWTTCAQADPGSEWANEARKRADEIRKRLSEPRPQSRHKSQTTTLGDQPSKMKF